jgi:chitinase
MTFTVRLSQPSTQSVTVKWETKGDTARSGSDYVGRGSSFTFAAGKTSQTISIQVRGDNTREADERFALNILSVVNASIADGSARGTIRNDD